MFGINNPQALLQPWKSLAHFSEELYAMFVSRAPVEREGPVTIRVKEGQTALRLVRGEDEPAQAQSPRLGRRANAVHAPRPRPVDTPGTRSVGAAPAPRPRPVEPRPAASAPASNPVAFPDGKVADQSGRRRNPDAGRAAEPPRRPGKRAADPTRPEPDSRRREKPPLLEVAGRVDFTGEEPARFRLPPQVYDPLRKSWYTPPAFDLPDVDMTHLIGGGGGTNVFVGKVLSHASGEPASCDLYPDGPEAAPDPSGPFQVKIPTLADGDSLPAGMWLFGVFLFSDADGNDAYYAQPPIWVA